MIKETFEPTGEWQEVDRSKDPHVEIWITCLWCPVQFVRTAHGGPDKKFCGDRCRASYHYALRRWAQLAVDAGLVPVVAFKKFGPEKGHYG